MLDLTWESEFEASGDAEKELLAELRMDCHREDIPEPQRPLLLKLARLKKGLDDARAEAIAAVDGESEEAQEVSAVTLQSTSVSYLTSAQNPYGAKAKAAKAYEAMQREYEDLYLRLVHRLRKFPVRQRRQERDVIEF